MNGIMIIDYGTMADPIERQLNDYGYTLGDEAHASLIQRAVFSVNYLRINGYIPESVADKVYKKIAKRVGEMAMPMEEKE